MLRRMSTNAMSSVNVVLNLKHVQGKIQAAAARRPEHLQYFQPRLVAVSKTKDVDMIFEAYDGGHRHFGENYVTELHEKANDIEMMDRCKEIRWHYIGHLQTNKIKKVLDVPNLYMVETIDSIRIAKALDEGCVKFNWKDPLNIMVQCNTSAEDNKHGCSPEEVSTLVKFINEKCSHLNLMGLMTIGRFDHDLSEGPNPDFLKLLSIRHTICQELDINEEHLELSMGMSADYEHAIELGSSNVRVGTTIFGARDYKDTKVEDDKTSTNDITGNRNESQGLSVSTCHTDSRADTGASAKNVTIPCPTAFPGSSSVADGYIQERLEAVQGLEGRTNDIFVCGNMKNCSELIIFFGGDIQEYPERMASHQDNHYYIKWNLEATSLKILDKFPDSLVMTIKPSEMYLMTYSMYHNFVEMSQNAPFHKEDHSAIVHLLQLCKSLTNLLHSQHKVDFDPNGTLPLRVIGFSKGCLALNQMVFELPLLDKDETLNRFFHRLKSIHWLDGGHSGGTENTWVNQDDVLQRLAALPCQIFINVTPYQTKDPMRPWVGKQEAKFNKKLKEFKAQVHHVIHFESEPASIENHFRVLDQFW